MLAKSFVPEHFEEMVAKLFLPWQYRELGMIVAYPGSDWYRRVHQASYSQYATKYKWNKWKIGDYRVEKWQDAESLREWIGDGRQIVVAGAETMFREQRVDLVKVLQEMYRTEERYVMLIAE